MGTNNYLVNVKEQKYVWFAGSRQGVHRDMELEGIYADSVDILGMFLDAYKNVPLIHLSDDGADAHGISMEGFNQFTEDDHKQIAQEQRRLYSESQHSGFIKGWVTGHYRLFPDLSSIWVALKDLKPKVRTLMDKDLIDKVNRGDMVFATSGMKGVHKPEGGWKEHTWYLCLGAFSTTNPIHEVVMCVGFVDDEGNPSGYSSLLSVTGGDKLNFNSLYFLQPIEELHTEK